MVYARRTIPDPSFIAAREGLKTLVSRGLRRAFRTNARGENHRDAGAFGSKNPFIERAHG